MLPDPFLQQKVDSAPNLDELGIHRPAFGELTVAGEVLRMTSGAIKTDLVIKTQQCEEETVPFPRNLDSALPFLPGQQVKYSSKLSNLMSDLTWKDHNTYLYEYTIELTSGPQTGSIYEGKGKYTESVPDG